MSLTTYRLTEHHTAGGMTRQLSHLAELQPELFCEISPELAAELDVANGDWVTITSARGLVSVKALVTSRMHRLWIEGRSVHTVGIPYHWGWKGLVTGAMRQRSRSPSPKTLMCASWRARRWSAILCPARVSDGKPHLISCKQQMQRDRMSTYHWILYRLHLVHRLQGL